MTEQAAEDPVLHVKIPRPLYDRLIAKKESLPYKTPLSSVARGLMEEALDADDKKNARPKK